MKLTPEDIGVLTSSLAPKIAELIEDEVCQKHGPATEEDVYDQVLREIAEDLSTILAVITL